MPRGKRVYKRRAYGKRRVSKKPKVSKSVKKYVKNQIHRQIEDKQAIYVYARTGIQSTDVATGPIVLSLVPNIYQGTEVCDRIGNKVRVKNVQFKYILTRSSTTGAANPPLYVTVVIGKLKNTFDTPAVGDLNLIKYNDSSAGTVSNTGIYSADLTTLQLPYNTDVWDIKYTRKFKLWNASNSTAANTFANNDFNLMTDQTVNITKMLKKVWTYNNATNQFPENDGLFAMFFANTIDSSASFTNAIFVDACLVCKYEDA